MEIKPNTKCCFISAIGLTDDTRIAAIARLLQADMTVFTVMPGSGTPGNVHTPLEPVRHFFVNNSTFPNVCGAIYSRVRNSLKAFREVRKLKPDIYLCIEPDSWIVAVLAKFLCGGAVVVDLQEYYLDRSGAFPRLLRPIVRFVLRTAMRLLASQTELALHVSDERKEAYRWLTCPSALFTLYPDVAQYPASPAAAEHAPVTVVHAGALRSSYASAQLIHAMKLVHDRNPRVRLLVLGGTFGELGAPAEFAALVAGGTIVVKGKMRSEAVAQELLQSDIGLSLVLPIDTTHVLAQPRKLYEYMCAGIPVVASDVPTVRRVVTENECGLLADGTRPESIAAAILRLAEDVELRHRMGRNGRQAMQNRFSASQQADNLILNLKELVTVAG